MGQSRGGVQSARLGLGTREHVQLLMSMVAVLLHHKAFKAAFEFVLGRVSFT